MNMEKPHAQMLAYETTLIKANRCPQQLHMRIPRCNMTGSPFVTGKKEGLLRQTIKQQQTI